MSEMDREAHAEDEPRGGTGLVDAFKILSKVPYERQLSLTFKLGGSLAEELVHAMSLISLGKRSEALDKLQALGDNNIIANHLVEKVRMCGVKLEDLTVSIDPFQESTVGTLADLARIFKVLAEERLCDSSLRDLAYQTALATCKHNNSGEESSESEYIQMQLREEAKRVCGPQIEDTVRGMCFPKDSSSGLCSIPPLDQGSTALQKSGFPNQTGSGHSPPSSLRDDTSICSYPTHLEISVSETDGFKTSNIPSQPPPPMNLEPVQSPVPNCGTNTGDEGAFKYFSRVTSRDTPPTQNVPEPVKGEMDRVTSVAVSREHGTGSEEVRVSPLSPFSFTPAHTKFDNPESPNAHSDPCPKNNLVPTSNTNRPTSHPTTTEPVSASVPLKTPNQKMEEEEVFFSFVILHAAEDKDMAETFKEKLEAIVVGEGATFSQEFAVPGRNTLMCVEDAINNSAFTILMLTRNFNTRLLEVETSSVLMNAIENRHKYNTVIPFLPQENRMPRENMPKVLRIFIPLEEGNAFEKKAKKAMAPARIAQQRTVWLSEQAVRAQVRRQERLRLEEKLQMDFIRECQETKRLENERMQRYLLQQHLANQPSTPAMPHFTAPFLGSMPVNVSNMSVTPQQDGWSHPSGNIHIQNARYIMFGNDSKMTVRQGGDSSGDEDDMF